MRNKAIDTVGGIMILFMIYRHVILFMNDGSWFTGALTYYPLLFFMAWFFFKGGMFHREEALEKTLVKGIQRLLVPYLVFSAVAVILTALVYGCVQGMEGVLSVIRDIPVYLKREGAVICNSPLWFILSLFFVRLFFSAAREPHIPVVCIALVSLAASYGLYLASLPIGLYIENIATGLFFFSSGYLLKDRQYDKGVFWVSAVIYVVNLGYCLVRRDVVGEFVINTHTPYFPTILYYLAGIITFDNLFRRFSGLQSDWLARIGQDSMIYYITHFTPIYLILFLNENVFHLNQWMVLSLLVISLVILLPLCKRVLAQDRFRWMTGTGKSLMSIPVNHTVALVGTLMTALAMTAYVLRLFLV